MTGNVKLMTSAGGGVILDTATTTSTDVTVKVPVTGVNNGTLVCSDSSGNVGIGTSSPDNNANRKTLTIDGTTAGTIDFKSSGTLTLQIEGTTNGSTFDTVGAYPHRFYTGGSERMRIDSSGNLLVGSNTIAPSTTGGVYLFGGSTGNGNGIIQTNYQGTGGGVSCLLMYTSYSVANQTKFEVTSEGNVKSRTNSYAGFSDERLKQNIKPASSQWNDIKAYDVVKFQMKSEQFSDEENPWMLGVVAQQVEQTSPGLVDVDPKDGMKTVKYSILYMKAVKALQEAMDRIEKLEAEVNELKAKVTV